MDLTWISTTKLKMKILFSCFKMSQTLQRLREGSRGLIEDPLFILTIHQSSHHPVAPNIFTHELGRAESCEVVPRATEVEAFFSPSQDSSPVLGWPVSW